MSNFYVEDSGEHLVLPGSDIARTIAEAITLSSAGQPFTFEFNDVLVSVLPDSDPELIYRDWRRVLSGYVEATAVGPHPKPDLTIEEMENDRRIEAENKRRRDEVLHQSREERHTKRINVELKLIGLPPMEVKDEQAWMETQRELIPHSYEGATATFAERWARLMQAEMEVGKNLQDMAEATSSEADFEGITGNMHNTAVLLLTKHWKHGEQLRRWHNSRYGDMSDQPDDGGVRNYAVIDIGSS